MKIAFIRKTFNPYGGAENYLNSLIRHLKNSGNDIHVLSTNWTDCENIHCHQIETFNLNSLTSILSFNRNTMHVAEALNCDCTVSFERTTCQDIYRAGDGCHKQWLILRGQGVGRLRRLSFDLNPMHRTLLSIERQCFHTTPLIVANSRMVKEQIMEHYGIGDDRIVVLYNGVDLERFRRPTVNRSSCVVQVREKFGIPEEGCRLLLFAGSGFERKGLALAVSALAHLGAEFRMIVAGAGSTLKYRRLAKELGVSDRVVFAGPQSGIERLYVAADVFVLPTLYDPFSNATLEAMACGTAAVTTKNNGAAEIIQHGRDGLIMDNPRNPLELADKIKQIAENREIYALNAVEKAAAYPISQAAATFLSLIQAHKGERNHPPKIYAPEKNSS
ncbi:MAG: glycosyltransferase family 4 protein [Nitrospirae bacterium]|uniref:glycosyltransferase family 4 protein n=1 Tax=Candidatus Magnetobacterium casense TaxID=1455061 RepID=UPI0005900E97|nr:glycosyltransferase family 4 protein [Candidatus Magnetobacterium casensis]MBF0338061.1 glycosyltransferase family 4 protein [Nitrospirota bacterium]